MSSCSRHQYFLNYQAQLEQALGEPLSVSGLSGPLRIFQRLNGHRHSIDDTLTAWYALQKCPNAKEVLDLGTGIGSVGQIVLWGLNANDALLTCVEAQEVSYKLLEANILCNGLSARVTPIFGDLRSLNLEQKFQLITGSPPYFPKSAGILPEDSQKAHARFELRGDVSDYARAALRHLKPDGVFVYCFPFQQKSRGIKLVTECGLKIVSVQDVYPRADKAALFSLYCASQSCLHPTIEEAPIIVADQNGRYTPQMLEIQKTRGFGVEGSNQLS